MCAACDVINRDEHDIEKFAEAMDHSKNTINQFLKEIFPITCEEPEPIGEQDFVN